MCSLREKFRICSQIYDEVVRLEKSLTLRVGEVVSVGIAVRRLLEQLNTRADVMRVAIRRQLLSPLTVKPFAVHLATNKFRYRQL